MTQGRYRILAVLLAWGLGMGAAAAETTGAGEGHDRVDELFGRYNLQPAFEKGGRGLSNVFFGWLEIPLGVDARYSTHDVVGTTLTGTGVGVIKGLVRTGVGLYETLTFLLPYPENFAPILPTLPYFQRTPQRRRLPLE